MGDYLVKHATFTKEGAYLPAGSIARNLDDGAIKATDTNLEKLDGDIPALPNVQVSPIAPTGPNPVNPQQIPPDATQTIAGYEQPGARLVGEVTKPEEQRIAAALLDDDSTADTQGEIVAQLERGAGGNDDDALVAGTVAQITSTLGDKSDDELRQLQAAEQDREQPRSGLLRAIDKELSSRQS